jgi:serine/threonine protein kinase
VTGISAEFGGEHAPGEMVGPYRIKSMIALGGMGRVYLALGPHGEEVALKLVKPDIARDEVVRRRFAREAKMAQRIDHPHVVPVLDVGEHEGVPYLAQAFVRGGTLEERIERNGPLPVAEAVRMCVEVADGLDALHAVGLVHRDMKPANILLDEQQRAYITDFGLAKDTQGSMLTRPGQALGSLDYMSPEQIRAETVGPATDVYGLGCVMLACLTGTPPFADRQGMSVLWAHLQEAPPDPALARSDLPEGFGAAVLRGLEKDPADRPQSATEYARAIADTVG